MTVLGTVRASATGGLAVLLVVGTGWWRVGGAQAPVESAPPAPDAAVVVTPAEGAVGTEVVVELRGWPDGAVFVSTCGNGARRGSEDCNQPATRSVVVRGGLATTRLRLSAPPIHCPCVVRAATTDGRLVRAAAIALGGVADGPPVLPAAGRAAAGDLEVGARLAPPGPGLVDRVAPLVAGPVRTDLVVRLRNTGTDPVRGLVVTAAVGRRGADATPVGRRTVDEVAPGATARVTVPVALDAPTWGRYEVRGSVFGLSAPVAFEAQTQVDPWLVEVLVPLTLLVVAGAARRRERRRAAADPDGDLLADSSLRVGADDEGRSRAGAYGPPVVPVP